MDSRGTLPDSLPSSHCASSFTHHDFDAARLVERRSDACPVIGCAGTPYPGSVPPYCVEHGIRLHDTTFVYFNGPAIEEGRTARLRNIAFAPKFVGDHVLDSRNKAETHRLGHETSEDALSWNVFAALLLGERLREAASWLTGKELQTQPHLYLWGCLVDFARNDSPPFAPLVAARKRLEPDIHKFVTEPDIMLVVPGELVICIEAKFRSGNPLATRTAAEPGAKPTTVDALVSRYLGISGAWDRERHCLVREKIPQRLPTQLFRNVVFASRMAEIEGCEAEWHVVNLVSSTQWSGQKTSDKYSFEDPTERMRQFLSDEARDNFTFRSWEGLYSTIVKEDTKLSQLRAHFEGKSANYGRAFTLA
jgi:hypothetical protein